MFRDRATTTEKHDMGYSTAEVENAMICSNRKIFKYYFLKIFEAFRAIMICFQGLLNSRVVSF